MASRCDPQVSFVLATHNRKAVVEHTLCQLENCGLERRDYEILLVDNASEDGTPGSIRRRVDLLIQLQRNAGSCAKAYATDHARGRYIVFLDDDSYPRPKAVGRMIDHFEADDSLAAAGFTIHLPDGGRECGALPHVFVGCGAGFRADALRGCGGLDRTFFMQAEEYDLSFRLAARGWRVHIFDDLHVEHLKTLHARRHERTTYFDVRNNLRVIARYLPAEFAQAYRADCLQRYQWLAKREGHQDAFVRGRRAGTWYAAWERWTHRSMRLAPDIFEHFFQLGAIQQRMAGLADSGVRRILFADFGKNVYAFHRAAGLAKMEIAAIADDRFSAADRTYRGVPIWTVANAIKSRFDAVVVSNCAPVFAANTERLFRGCCSQPVHSWFSESSELLCEPANLHPGNESVDERGSGTNIGPKTAVHSL